VKSFKDNQGQQWNLALSLTKIRRMREKLGLELLNPEHFLKVCTSVTDQMAFCFLLVEDQAKSLGLNDPDQFEERLYGEGVSTAACFALLEETELFSQKLGQKALAALAKKMIEIMKAGNANLDHMLATGQLDLLMDKAQEETLKKLQESGGNGLPS
jgi:hypothetical protein